MRLSRSTHAETAAAFGFVLAALVLAAPNSIAKASSSAMVSVHRTLPRRSIDPRAAAQVPAARVALWPDIFGSYKAAPRTPETDGLSRNPADCVKYGCIDNGG